MNGLIIIMVFLLQLWTPELVLELVPYLSPYRWSKHHLSTDIWKLFIPSGMNFGRFSLGKRENLNKQKVF